MSAEPQVRVTLTEKFQELSNELLSEYETEGLYRFLGNNPLAGSESTVVPGLLELKWRKDGSVIVEYSVNKEMDEVLLISMYSEDDPPPNDRERKKMKNSMGSLKRFGFGYGIRELIEIAKDNWPF